MSSMLDRELRRIDETLKDMTAGDVHQPSDHARSRRRRKKPVRSGEGETDADGDNDTENTKRFEGGRFAIVKLDPDKQMIFGWASVSAIDGVDVVDKQEDIIPIEELEDAAYDFVLYSRDQGDMHAKRGVGRLIEAMVFTPEKAKHGLVAKNEKGQTISGLWVGFRVEDPEVWAAHKRGDRPEFSIGGSCGSFEQR